VEGSQRKTIALQRRRCVCTPHWRSNTYISPFTEDMCVLMGCIYV
jgi:hypothetical protein